MSRNGQVAGLTVLSVFCIAAALSAEDVGQWDRFETSLKNTRSFADPYGDVTLDVMYTRPDGSQVAFWGFYDGAATWKLRFMPDQLGTWKYDAAFSDGSGDASGTFECVPSDLPGMIAIDRDNPMWFGYRGGGHVLLRGLHVGDRFFSANWSDEKRRAFLEWAGEQGYNLLSIASHYLNRDEPGRGRGWQTPRLWPLDAGEYQRMERVLDELAARRIIVFPFAGFFGKSSNYPRETADQDLYVRYTLARLGPYWNVLLNVAGPEPNVGRGWMPKDEVVRLGEIIEHLDVFGHPLSVHNRTGDDPYRDAMWTTFGTLQGPKTTDRRRLSRGLLANHHASKPLFAQETLWSGNENHPDYSDTDLRKNAFVINMSATALCFGDMDGNSSSGFSGTMELADRNQRRHDIVKQVWDFFETIPFYRMKPNQALVDNGYCLAQVGREYCVYLESPGDVSVAVEDGPYQIEWIDAENTKNRRHVGTTTDGRNLSSPREGEDWILRLYKH